MPTRAHTVPRFYLAGFVDPESEELRDPYVWLGSIKTGMIVRRAPKNISTIPGAYDGPGGFEKLDASIERHLSKIESAASSAIRAFAATPIKSGAKIGPEIMRFMAWQAPRTPGWMELVQKWIDDFDPDAPIKTVEAPPTWLTAAKARHRPFCMKSPTTGEMEVVTEVSDWRRLKKAGWIWILGRDEQLEMLHIQASYFLDRHFPRLSWTRLEPPQGQWFITGNRGVTWTAQGQIDTPPAALRHPTAQVIAPLTRRVTLVGTHGAATHGVTPREVNRAIACTSSEWIVGPTEFIVMQAMRDRADLFVSGS
jgi:hypothetical protein